MSRYNENRSFIDNCIAMADGNPGAITAVIAVAGKVGAPNIFDFVRKLDANSVYGSDVWVCYKDLCEQDPQKFYDDVMSGEVFKKLEAMPEYIRGK